METSPNEQKKDVHWTEQWEGCLDLYRSHKPIKSLRDKLAKPRRTRFLRVISELLHSGPSVEIPKATLTKYRNGGGCSRSHLWSTIMSMQSQLLMPSGTPYIPFTPTCLHSTLWSQKANTVLHLSKCHNVFPASEVKLFSWVYVNEFLCFKCSYKSICCT